MGLDMYLSVRKYVSRIDFSKDYDKSEGYRNTPEFDSLVDTLGVSEFIEPQDSAGIHVEVPVMYWRKANAIHKWFVDEQADGVDECQPINVSTESLKELVDLCEQELSYKYEPGLYLPTESGFFFGSTAYDEYYIQDLEYTRDRLKQVIKTMEKSGDHFAVYQASW
jgi:hypothetical protein